MTYGDLYKEVAAAGTATKGKEALMKKGYSEETALEIIRQGMAGGYIK